jgi:hypothetical protein
MLTRALARADGDCAALETEVDQVAKAAESHPWEGADQEEPITKESLRQLIREELTAAQKPVETKKSWAAVAATAATSTTTTAHQPALAAKVVPARHLREVVMRAEGATEDITKRTAKEVVTAVNTASNRKDAWQRGVCPAGTRS